MEAHAQTAQRIAGNVNKPIHPFKAKPPELLYSARLKSWVGWQEDVPVEEGNRLGLVYVSSYPLR